MKKFTLYFLGFLSLCLAGFSIWAQYSANVKWEQLQAYLAELDRTDPGWRLEEIQSERNSHFPPDDENASVISKEANLLLQKSYQEWLKNPTGTQPEIDWLPDVELNRLPPEEYSALATCIADENREAIEKARSLRFCQKDGGVVLIVPANPIDTLLPNVDNVRMTGSVLKLDSAIAAIQGDGNRAIESVQAGLHMGKALVGEPTLVSNLVRIAMISLAVGNLERTLALTEPTTGLKELQAEFAAETRVPGLFLATRGERALNNVLFENIEDGKTDLSFTRWGQELSPPPVVDRFNVWQYRGRISPDHLVYLQTMTQMLEIMQKPLHEQKDLVSNVKAPDRRYIISHLMFPAFQKLFQAEYRVQTQMRCAVVAIGCERFRQKNQRWPTDLGELGTEFLPEGIPIDPYSGQPLQYKRYAGEAVIYGLGEDRKDDQGILSPTGKAGTDLGFRLWDADRRSMEPLPAKSPPE